MFFGFLKVIAQLIFKCCSNIYTEGATQLARQYDNRAMTTKQEDHIIIEVEMNAQELALNYEMGYENYFLMILEYPSVLQKHRLVCRTQQYGTSYEKSCEFIPTNFK